jgi:REP element-mobilizing transposase RayT
MTLSSPITITHRNLPHWHGEGSIYWLTFRLADSLPAKKLSKWKRHRDIWCRMHPRPWSDEEWREYQRCFGLRLEQWLDAGFGACVLRHSVVRAEVVRSITHFHEQRYRIHHGVVMPNHVHLLIEPFPGHQLSEVMKGMKGGSSRRCNQILGARGRFWMAESFDHIVRSRAEYDHYVRYIEDNPIRSHLGPDEFWLWDGSSGTPA